ncbi:GNAT family N-acetyltransferase [Propionibacteriaceae bacterium G1746]|uniref:GNAT family N-acetyltransferase n=1 Tax=Aestuariimicrobium sp. G57 TaxID=3418485 RepID=UPI003C267F2E
MTSYDLHLIDSSTRTPETDAWTRAVLLGFLDADPVDAVLATFAESRAADDARLRAVRPTDDRDTLPGQVAAPLATFRSWDNTINTGHGHLEPANFITDVTVRQTERRRGMLRTMMMTDLHEARDRGQSLAALTVTEATIYSRFGFGVATAIHELALDIRHGFGLRHEPAGRVVHLDPAAEGTAQTWTRVFDQFHAQTFGSAGASAHHLAALTGRFNWTDGSVDRAVRTVAHVDESGAVDGVLSYKINNGDELQVIDLVPLNPEAELGLWAFIGHHDLLERAVWRRGNPDGPLRWALTDSRRLKVTGVMDGIWLRVLDIAAALRVRHFERDGRLLAGEVVLGIDDPTGITPGIWRLVVRDGIAEAEPTTHDPDVTMGVDTFASLYLGGVSAQVLAAAGRLHGGPAAVAALADLFGVSVAPRSLRYF